MRAGGKNPPLGEPPHDRRFGEAVASLRRDRALRQYALEGLSERQVRRIEMGQSRPRVSTLRKLAAAHGLALDAYLGEIARRAQLSRGRSAKTGTHG